MKIKKTLLLAFILAFTAISAVNVINKVDFQMKGANGLVIVDSSETLSADCFPLKDISMIVIKDATISAPKEFEGDGEKIKKISVFQMLGTSVQEVGILITHAEYVNLQINGQNVDIILGKADIPSQPENVALISKDRMRNRLFELAEELFAVEKYDEATVMYNSIYSDDFYAPLALVNAVRMELKMDPIKSAPEPQPVEEVVEEPVKEEPVKEEPVKEELVEEPVKEEPVKEEVVEEPVKEEPVKEEPVKEEVVEEPVKEEPVKEEPVKEEVVEEPVKEEPVKEEPVKEEVVEEPVKEVPKKILTAIKEINIISEKEMTRLQVFAETKLFYEFTKNDKTSSVEIRLFDAEFTGSLPEKGGFIKSLTGSQLGEKYILNIAYVKDADISIFPIDNLIECDILKPVEKKEEVKKYVEFEAEKEKKTGLKSQTLVEQKKYRGYSKISLHLNNASLTSLLRLISMETGVNIYSDPGVAGKISIDVDNQPWEPTLDVILKNYELTYEWEGTQIIRVTNLDKLKKEKEEQKKAIESKENLLPLMTRIYQLSFAKANSLSSFLKAPLVSKRGSVDYNARNNILIVRDTEEKLGVIDKLIKELDEQTRQVNILVRIYRLNDVQSTSLGINWNFNNSSSPGDTPISGGVNLGSGASGSTLFGENFGMVSLFTASQFANIDMTLTALMNKNKVTLETFPNITTLNHQSANITIGQKVPITMLDEAGNTVTQLTTIGTKIKVTPHINADGTVILKIHPEISNLAGVVAGLINIATSEADTTMMVKNGDTAVIGGLVEYRMTTTNQFIPFLSKIPLIGLLFKNKSKTFNQGEILIFVTPKIIE